MSSCLLCGVGGQGTVLASRILATAAMEKGLFARTAETIGMAQRGGSVVSHVRVGNDFVSPLIPIGKADMIIGFEPGEAVRCLPYLKEGGTVIVCDKAVQPVTASLSGENYSGEEMIAYLKEKVSKCHVVNVDGIIENCGSDKVINVALIGAAVTCGDLEFGLEDIKAILQTKLKKEYLEMNYKALACGAEI